MQEHKLDAAALAKQAPGGRLTKEFVLSHLEKRAGNMMGSNGEKAAAVMPDTAPSKGTPLPPRRRRHRLPPPRARARRRR